MPCSRSASAAQLTSLSTSTTGATFASTSAGANAPTRKGEYVEGASCPVCRFTGPAMLTTQLRMVPVVCAAAAPTAARTSGRRSAPSTGAADRLFSVGQRSVLQVERVRDDAVGSEGDRQGRGMVGPESAVGAGAAPTADLPSALDHDAGIGQATHALGNGRLGDAGAGRDLGAGQAVGVQQLLEHPPVGQPAQHFRRRAVGLARGDRRLAQSEPAPADLVELAGLEPVGPASLVVLLGEVEGAATGQERLPHQAGVALVLAAPGR